MFQYLENPTKGPNTYWQIELKGQILSIEYGEIESNGETIEQVLEDEIEAFHLYKEELLKKLQEGYIDPKGKVAEKDVLDVMYEGYLEQNKLDAAADWLKKWGHIPDSSYEDKLIEAYLKKEQYVLAEKHVLEKIQVVKDLNVIIRQVRYLSLINPMLCRFMIGNLPPNSQPINALAYYKDLARAQSQIGMFSTVSTTIKTISSDYIGMHYFINLLETAHQDLEPQMNILEKAIDLLDGASFSIDKKAVLYHSLSKGARNIQANETAEKLSKLAVILAEE